MACRLPRFQLTGFRTQSSCKFWSEFALFRTFLLPLTPPAWFRLFEAGPLGGGDEPRYEVGGGGVGGLFFQDVVQGPDVAGAPGGQLVHQRLHWQLGEAGGTLIDQLPLALQILVQHVAAERRQVLLLRL